MIKQYRKKAVTISAIQYKPSNIRATFAFCKPDLSSDALDGVAAMRAPLFIETLEGTMEAKYGDYIIQGVAGEFYPCKPDIFTQSYEMATPEAEETYLTRMIVEYAELDAKYQKLSAALAGPRSEKIDKQSWQMMEEQHQSMSAYRQTLAARIDYAENLAG